MTLEHDDPIYNPEHEDDERDMDTPDMYEPDEVKDPLEGIIAEELAKSNNPADQCTAEPEDLMDIMDSQAENKFYQS